MCSSVRPNINGESSCASLPFVFHLPDFPHINGLIISRVGEPSAFLGKTRNITIIIVSLQNIKKRKWTVTNLRDGSEPSILLDEKEKEKNDDFATPFGDILSFFLIVDV